MMTKEEIMQQALILAEKAQKKDEVPVGAVVVKGDKIISLAFNKKETKHCAIFHAEILAIKKACKKLKTWNLTGCSIFVTKQPCLMCYGAILSSRIDAIYFGAYDKKYGMQVEKYEELNEKGFNHKCRVEGGICEEECAKLLTNFFKDKR